MSAAFRTAWIWRVILFKGFNNWFIVFGTSITASNIAAHYAYFSEGKTALLLALMAGAKAIEAFMNQDLGKLKAQIAADLDASIWTRTAQQPQTVSQTFTPNPSTETKPT
jgi:hypothetical protein